MVAGLTKEHTCAPTHDQQEGSRAQCVQSAGCRGHGRAVPLYFDSRSTVFVVSSDTSVKKSAWLIRRVDVLQEAVEHGSIQPIHISERDMAADHLGRVRGSRRLHFEGFHLLGLLPESELVQSTVEGGRRLERCARQCRTELYYVPHQTRTLDAELVRLL